MAASKRRSSSLFLAAPLVYALVHIFIQAPRGLLHLEAVGSHMPRSRRPSAGGSGGAAAALLRRVETLEAKQATALVALRGGNGSSLTRGSACEPPWWRQSYV